MDKIIEKATYYLDGLITHQELQYELALIIAGEELSEADMLRLAKLLTKE